MAWEVRSAAGTPGASPGSSTSAGGGHLADFPQKKEHYKTSGGFQENKVKDKGFLCEECGVMLENKGLKDAHAHGCS